MIQLAVPLHCRFKNKGNSLGGKVTSQHSTKDEYYFESTEEGGIVSKVGHRECIFNQQRRNHSGIMHSSLPSPSPPPSVEMISLASVRSGIPGILHCNVTSLQSKGI